MARFKIKEPFTVSMILLIPTATKAYGVPKKVYPAVEDGIPFNGNFKSYGGMETNVNGLYSIDDTATIETWFRPEIQKGCRIVVLPTGDIYEIVGKPENINLRNQYLRIKVIRYEGGA